MAGALVDVEGIGIGTGGSGPVFASDPQGANLGTVDSATGLFTVIGPFTGAVAQITEIEWSPDGSTLYASTGGGGTTLDGGRQGVRRFIGIELSKTDAEMARDKLSKWWDPPNLAPRPAPAGQAKLEGV